MARLVKPLTATQVHNAKPKDAPYKLFDGGGLFLHVTPSGGKHWKMKYRQANGKESILHLTNGTTTVRQLLGSIEESLPREFVRISRKHIVNVLYVSKVEGNTILLADETLLPIPKRKVVEVRRALGSLPQRREE